MEYGKTRWTDDFIAVVGVRWMEAAHDCCSWRRLREAYVDLSIWLMMIMTYHWVKFSLQTIPHRQYCFPLFEILRN